MGVHTTEYQELGKYEPIHSVGTKVEVIKDILGVKGAKMRRHQIVPVGTKGRLLENLYALNHSVRVDFEGYGKRTIQFQKYVEVIE